ncbi:uncharacterized protein AAES06_010738 [Glossophaga mutica]
MPYWRLSLSSPDCKLLMVMVSAVSTSHPCIWQNSSAGPSMGTSTFDIIQGSSSQVPSRLSEHDGSRMHCGHHCLALPANLVIQGGLAGWVAMRTSGQTQCLEGLLSSSATDRWEQL